MSIEPTDTPTNNAMDFWRVQLASGEVRTLSLDALDDAFQAGVISEDTPVLPPGATAWTKLADAAGLDSDAPVEQNVNSLAPLAVTVAETTGESTPYSSSNAAARHPVLTDEALMQLALDDESAFKPKRGRVFAGIGVAVLLVGGLGFAATRVSNAATSASNSLSAGAPNVAAAAAPPAAIDPSNIPGKTLTDEQKAKLAEADKAREAAAAARDAQRRKDHPTSTVRRGPREKSSQPFVNGGNKFDPLNGAL
jgi:hypothetical protein